MFDGSSGKHGIPIFERKMATAILWSFSLPVGYGYAAGLSIRGGNLTTRTPLLSVPWMTFYKMLSSSKAQAGGL